MCRNVSLLKSYSSSCPRFSRWLKILMFLFYLYEVIVWIFKNHQWIIKKKKPRVRQEYSRYFNKTMKDDLNNIADSAHIVFPIRVYLMKKKKKMRFHQREYESGLYIIISGRVMFYVITWGNRKLCIFDTTLDLNAIEENSTTV